MMNWIPVFRTGTHTDSAGNQRDWTEGDLDHMVAGYDPARHEAPAVIGHPKDNAPAWGWVEALRRDGGTLLAAFKGLVPEFVEMVRKGMFKKRSISLYGDGTLRHIGFLGAQPPAVKGLPDIAFSDEGGFTIEFEEQNRKEAYTMSFMDKLKTLMQEAGVKIDADPAPKSFSEAEVRDLVATAIREQKGALDKQTADFAEERKSAADELKAREDKLRTDEIAAAKGRIASFCEGLLKEGKVVPAMMKHGMGLQTFMEQISASAAPVEFSEGDEKKTQTPLEFMQSFLQALPKAIEFGEVSGGAHAGGATGADAAAKLDTFTRAKMEENKDLSYSQAFAEAQKEYPELAAEYAAELG